MRPKDLEEIISPLHLYGTGSFVLSTGRKFSTPTFAWDNIRNDVIGYQWYQLQSAAINSFGFHFSKDLVDILYKSNTFSLNSIEDDKQKQISASGQFPPDIIKSTRLYASLESFQPDLILELGCGTSSLVISKYLVDSNRSQECRYIVVDKEKEWINQTQEKIKSFFDQSFENSLFYLHNSNIDTVHFVRSEILKSNKQIFIYLDASILDGEKFQGIGLILETFDQFQGELCLLIDSRYKAYSQLFKLANLLNRELSIITNVLETDESEALGPVKLQMMSAFTLAKTVK